MRIGIIGCGVVGGTLIEWLKAHTKHDLRLVDPPKGYEASLTGCDYVFVSVPVPASGRGQDTTLLEDAIDRAHKANCANIFVRSTVLPGTNDYFGTIAMPEFLTERRAYEDFCTLPILVGGEFRELNFDEVFPDKTIIKMSNKEAELAKLAHNCFGAFKVTYFNIIEELSRKLGAKYPNVLGGAMLTEFIEPTHTLVPGPDGLRGYGGKCFPENVDAMTRFLMSESLGMPEAQMFFSLLKDLNTHHRAPFFKSHLERVQQEAHA